MSSSSCLPFNILQLSRFYPPFLEVMASKMEDIEHFNLRNRLSANFKIQFYETSKTAS